MIRFTTGGNTKNLEKFLSEMVKDNLYSGVERGAKRGVDALKRATPRESGLTAESWTYEIERKRDSTILWFLNTHVVNGFNVAIGLQYGHGTGTGGWVQGTDFINPALKEVFDQIADDVWEEVKKA